MSGVKLDWEFIAKNLARHLASVDDVQAMERIIEDAERDARALSAPSHFWTWVASEYCSQEKRIGRGTGAAFAELRRRQPDRPIFGPTQL